MFYTLADGHRSAGLRHNPINALVAPRPIAWVSTLDSRGRANLAPFSYYNLLSAEPPIVVFAPNSKDAAGAPKDSLRNVLETGEFVISVVPWRMRSAMNATSTLLPHGESEFEFAGLEPAPCRLVKPQRVAGSPASLECRLWKTVDLPCLPGGRRSTAILGEVVACHIDDAVVRDGVVDPLAVAAMARLGGFDYTYVREVATIPRPTGGE